MRRYQPLFPVVAYHRAAQPSVLTIIFLTIPLSRATTRPNNILYRYFDIHQLFVHGQQILHVDFIHELDNKSVGAVEYLIRSLPFLYQPGDFRWQAFVTARMSEHFCLRSYNVRIFKT